MRHLPFSICVGRAALAIAEAEFAYEWLVEQRLAALLKSAGLE
jgi:hypothetical protein